MKYFLHDTNSFDDEKVTELFMKYGYEGLGLFYTILEKIGKQEKPIKTEVLKAQLRVGKRLNKCWLFMEDIGIISSSNGETFNEQLLNFSEKYQIKKEKTREKVAEWREKQSVAKSVTGYETVSNTPKVKESKVNKSKDIRANEFAQHTKELNPDVGLNETNIQKFNLYWTQSGEKDKKLHFEKQKTFDHKKRMITWKLNNYGTDKQNDREAEKPVKRNYTVEPPGK